MNQKFNIDLVKRIWHYNMYVVPLKSGAIEKWHQIMMMCAVAQILYKERPTVANLCRW